MTDSLFIGVDIGGTSFRAARFRGHQHVPDAKIKQPTQPVAGRDDMLDRLADAIRELAGGDLSAVDGVGIAAPGPVDPHAGLVLEAPNIPGWLNLPLQRLMQARLNRPVFLGNDANIAALGEWKFGAGRGHRDVLYMTISTGIGGGVISGDKLILGARGLATEVGHIQIMPDGPRCGCGQLGCLEALASGTAITRIARERLERGAGADSQIHARLHGDLSLLNTVVIGQAALAGDAFARGLIAEAGGHIGYALASFLHLFNPSIVILGGGVSSLGEILFEPVRAAVQRYAMNEHYWRDCPIVPAGLGDDAGLVGAGALAMEESRARVMPDR
jgi:glucokinase